MRNITVSIRGDSRASFSNNAAFCIGTGRMGLALQQEYQEQLRAVQALCGFQHIRGHGLFCGDMSIYQPYKDAEGVEHEAYCFTYLDRVMDSYRAAGLRPFLELGFMPDQIASGEQTIFYWKGNVTPPKDEAKWVNLVTATLVHLKERYGEEEVSAWPCEVWNEPNLPGFWQNADKDAYLRLYEITAPAVKSVLPAMPVGGPAICGGEGSQGWIRDFLAFCEKKTLPVDFVSRHAYMGLSPEHRGRYLYHGMRTVDDLLAEMKESRDIIDSFPRYRGLPMHITEFNTSYNPFCPIHDTALNAATIAGLLARLGEVAASYSYWTFGDVFEEQGVPPTPFHGGFGLMANGLIAKPTLWTFNFFNNLQGECVYKDEHLVLTRRADGSFEGVAWNLCEQGEDDDLVIELRLPGRGDHALLTRTVDDDHGNPLSLWLTMGQPASLTGEQLSFLRQAAQPYCAAHAVAEEDGALVARLTLKKNAVAHIRVTVSEAKPDYGYDPGMYL